MMTMLTTEWRYKNELIVNNKILVISRLLLVLMLYGIYDFDHSVSIVATASYVYVFETYGETVSKKHIFSTSYTFNTNWIRIRIIRRMTMFRKICTYVWNSLIKRSDFFFFSSSSRRSHRQLLFFHNPIDFNLISLAKSIWINTAGWLYANANEEHTFCNNNQWITKVEYFVKWKFWWGNCSQYRWRRPTIRKKFQQFCDQER